MPTCFKRACRNTRILLPDGSPLPCRFARTPLARARGLLGTEASYLAGGVLCLQRCRDIHTFGMHYALDVAFLDSGGRVLLSCRVVPPSCRLRASGAVCVLERASTLSPWPVPGDLVRFVA